MERKIMDALAVKTEKVKVLTIILENAEKQVNDLLLEKVAMKSYITDVTGMLSDIVETKDSMITIMVRKHLAEKLRPIFAMLHCLECVQESSSILKQGREQSKKDGPKPSAKPIVKDKYDPKGKEKLFTEEPIIKQSEDKEPNENELKRTKAHEANMDKHQRIVREAEAKEKVEREAQLEPVVLFELQNTQGLQLDLPITPKAFKFRSFVRAVNVPFADSGTDHLLFLFYLKHMKPQYETWSASKITIVKVTSPIKIDSFPNVKFKVVKGFASQVHEFTLADLPCPNLYDWIMLYNLLLRYEKKYEPVIAHLKLMIVLYIQDVGKMNVEIVVVLRRKPFDLPKEVPEGFEKLKLGNIYKKGCHSVIEEEDWCFGGKEYHIFPKGGGRRELSLTELALRTEIYLPSKVHTNAYMEFITGSNKLTEGFKVEEEWRIIAKKAYQ
ncbi:unnamed protein product [Lactuca saligna]|uniref:Uncharacterized protein n=1 Tax=Lactuca saligna TaxID=75948 RepID=A0AA35Z9J5_LACSI|nr:unnamed protein product [Lactuca saligna]